MAGFIRNATYNWKIDLGQDGMYAEFEGTAEKAYSVLEDLKSEGLEPTMFCNGEQVTR